MFGHINNSTLYYKYCMAMLYNIEKTTFMMKSNLNNIVVILRSRH